MKKDSHVESQKRLQHIVEAIDEIQRYVLNETGISFCQSNIIHNAALFQLSVIGEAINLMEDEKLEKLKESERKKQEKKELLKQFKES